MIEKRLVDVALRRGINDMTVEKWRAFLELQRYFEKAIGRSIYSVLPGVVGGLLNRHGGHRILFQL